MSNTNFCLLNYTDVLKKCFIKNLYITCYMDIILSKFLVVFHLMPCRNFGSVFWVLLNLGGSIIRMNALRRRLFQGWNCSVVGSWYSFTSFSPNFNAESVCVWSLPKIVPVLCWHFSVADTSPIENVSIISKVIVGDNGSKQLCQT